MAFVPCSGQQPRGKTQHNPSYLPIIEKKFYVLFFCFFILDYNESILPSANKTRQPQQIRITMTFFFFLAHLVLLCHSTSTVFSSPSMAAGGARKSEGGSVRNPCRRPEPQDNKVDPHARKNLWRLRNFFMVSRLMLVFPGPLSVFMPSSTGEYRCQALKRPGSSVVCVESRSHMPSSRG